MALCHHIGGKVTILFRDLQVFMQKFFI